MRVLLTVLVTALAVGIGLATAILQSHNREEGIALDRMKQECSMLEAVNGARVADVLALDLGPLECRDADAVLNASEGVEGDVEGIE